MESSVPVVLPANRAVRFAIVGCGRVFGRHIESLESHGEVEIVAVCDVDAQALEQATRRTGAPGYSTLDAMLAEVNADVVSLATPSGLHPGQAALCARQGVHVLSEKPMGTRWGDALEMVRECEDAGVRLFVVKQQRFSPTVRLLRRAFDEKRFGRVYAVQMNVLWNRSQGYYDMADWRGTWELDGGALMNQAIHHIDLLQWLLGPVKSVHAHAATLARNIEVEDTAAVSLEWRSGALGTVTATMLTYPSNLEAAITILGERGTVRLAGKALNDIQMWDFSEPHAMDADLESVQHEPESVYGEGHSALYDAVIRALRGEEAEVVSGREGLKSLEIVIAAYRSAQEGRRVHLPLD